MVLEISQVCKSNLDSIRHTESSIPKAQTAEERYMNVLCYNREKGVFDKFIAQVKSGFFWVYEKAKGLFFQIISCFGVFQSADSKQLLMFKENLSKVREMEKQFPEQTKKIKDKELKNWWKSQFESLDPEVQTMLLIEDIKLREPEKGKEDKEKWAYENLEEYRTLATRFVVHLQNEMIQGQTYSPIEDLPGLLEGLLVTLESKIKHLEAPQK